MEGLGNESGEWGLLETTNTMWVVRSSQTLNSKVDQS